MTDEELEQIRRIIKAEISSVMGTAETDNNRRTFEEYSWEEIDDICNGYCGVEPEDVWKIGEEKPFKLITGEENAFRIIDFKHDERADGRGKAGVTVMFKNVIDGYYPWNYSGSTVGGYGKSDIHKTLERLFILLPSEIKAIIKPVIKYTGVGGGSSEVEQSFEKLFLLSYSEIAGIENDDYSGKEGKQYKFFEKEENRVLLNSYGEHTYWWERSAVTSYSCYAYHVTPTGSAGHSYYAYYSSSVSPACCF